tara:strand:+ start:650 stop:1252 length:603 start_codon:yes stop_codon:yes gene_type:complete
MDEYDHREVEQALQELKDSVNVQLRLASTRAPLTEYEQRRLLALRTEVRIRFLRSIKRNESVPLNRYDKNVVDKFNELLEGAERFSNYEFQLKANALLYANEESHRPQVSVYIEEMLDELDVHDGYHRQRVASLILAPTAHERANPAARKREIFLFVNANKFNAWKAELAQKHGMNYKIVFKEGRNPNKPGGFHNSTNML